MEISIEDSGPSGTVVVRLSGALHETESIALADRILNLMPSHAPSALIVDLSTCSLVSTMAISALVSLSLAPELESCRMSIRGQTTEADSRMRGLRLDRIFDLDPPVA